jgi:hypothetical protein
MNLLGLGFVGLFFILMLGFVLIIRKQETRNLRDIPAFYRLSGAVELSVEDGSRLHIAIGKNSINSTRSASALVGLRMLSQITHIASEGDHPPVATAGDPTLAILAQDSLRAAYHSLGRIDSYDPSLGRVAGLTPYSYAAGMLPIIQDEDVSVNVMVGSFDEEAGLVAVKAEQNQSFTLAGADSLPGQAVLFAAADEILIGEEMFAGGAYLDAGPAHVASLHAQDIVRYIVVLAIIGSAILNLVGII